MKRILESPKQIPVRLECDIVVVGGSCTGLFAAVRAARLGAKVAIVEKQNCFGGMATVGLVNVWHSLHDVDNKQQVIAGLTHEVIERLEKRRAVLYSGDENIAYRLDTEELKIELDALATESGIDIFFHTMYAGPVLEGDTLQGIFIENKDGRQAILAQFVIDATGDGDLGRDLGLPSFRQPVLQPPTPGFKLYGDISRLNIAHTLQKYGDRFGLPDDWGWGGPIPSMPMLSFRADTHLFGVDCAKADDLTRAEIEGRRQIRAVVDTLSHFAPYATDLHIAAIAASVGIRDTVHYVTDYQLNADDLLNGTAYEDAIAYGTYRVDIHHGSGAGITFRTLDGHEDIFYDRVGPAQHRRWRTGDDYARYYQIPFRALVQRKVPNLLQAGRMINADDGAFGAVRVMVNMNQVGEAAGVAAYLAIHGDAPVWAVEPKKLRETLKSGGSVIL